MQFNSSQNNSAQLNSSLINKTYSEIEKLQVGTISGRDLYFKFFINPRAF